MRFSYRMVPEVYQVFWAAMARGEFITDAAAEAGLRLPPNRGGIGYKESHAREAEEVRR